jgi:hypothetical protein
VHRFQILFTRHLLSGKILSVRPKIKYVCLQLPSYLTNFIGVFQLKKICCQTVQVTCWNRNEITVSIYTNNKGFSALLIGISYQNRNNLCLPVVCFPFYYLWALFLQILPLANAFSKASTKIRHTRGKVPNKHRA